MKDYSQIESIGFHLCGNRSENIGFYGFSSHYIPSPERERQAQEFIKRCSDETGKPIWIENANFYSSSAIDVISALESTCRVCKNSGAKMIVDLTHLLIDCENNGIQPQILLGRIDWNNVIELHLSGVVKGSDGVLHDAHNKEVPQKVWDMLFQLLQMQMISDDVFINLEHTDPVWGSKPKEFKYEYENLQEVIAAAKQEKKHQKMELYARSYLMKIVSHEVSNLDYICSAVGMEKERLMNGWLDHVERYGKRIVLSRQDIDASSAAWTEYYVDSFTRFINGV